MTVPEATDRTERADLIGWLRAQLDREQRAAEGMGIVAWLRFEWADGGLHYTAVASATVTAPDHWVIGGQDATGYVNAAVIYDERRVLAEVEAKRRILDWHGSPEQCSHCRSQALIDDGQSPCTLLRLLALPYAGRPGYDERWRR